MGRVVVEVMPKPEILDPQGKAVAGALPRLGFGQFTSVRQGKRFELEVDGDVTAGGARGRRAGRRHGAVEPGHRGRRPGRRHRGRRRRDGRLSGTVA